MDIGKRIKHQRVENALAAGSADENTAVVDRAGFQGVKWTVCWGTISATSVSSVKVQEGAASDGSDMADITGATSTAVTPSTDDNKITIVDLYRKTTKRYVRLVIKRATANAVVDSVVAELYEPAAEPVTQDTTVDELVTLVG